MRADLPFGVGSYRAAIRFQSNSKNFNSESAERAFASHRSQRRTDSVNMAFVEYSNVAYKHNLHIQRRASKVKFPSSNRSETLDYMFLRRTTPIVGGNSLGTHKLIAAQCADMVSAYERLNIFSTERLWSIVIALRLLALLPLLLGVMLVICSVLFYQSLNTNGIMGSIPLIYGCVVLSGLTFASYTLKIKAAKKWEDGT